MRSNEKVSLGPDANKGSEPAEKFDWLHLLGPEFLLAYVLGAILFGALLLSHQP